MSDAFQYVIIAFIVLSILYLVFRSGTANPESTGSLDRKVSGLSTSVSTLSSRVGNVESRMKELEESAVSQKDLEKLEELIGERLEGMNTKIEAHKEISAATNRNVQRIYDIMLDRGLGKQ